MEKLGESVWNRLTEAGIGNDVMELDCLLGERKVKPVLEWFDVVEIREEGVVWVVGGCGTVWKGGVMRSTSLE